ncbi:MAG: MoaD/ThiS family protein [Candidatus Methanofastidiosia archaeon]
MVKVKLLREKKEMDIQFTGKIKDLLPQLSYSIETAVVIKNDVPVEEDEEVGDEDELKILPVVSGG